MIDSSSRTRYPLRKKAGQTVEQIAAAYKIPERFKGYAAPAEARLKNNVQIVFDETK